MTDEEHVTVEAIPPGERSGNHIYTVYSHYAREALNFSGQDLLQIAAYVAEHRTRLEQEAQEDEARNERTWSQDKADMAQIKQEWYYRHSGDAEPPNSPAR
jgi:hypothetical protein